MCGLTQRGKALNLIPWGKPHVRTVIATLAAVLSTVALAGCEDISSSAGSESANDTPAVVKAGKPFDHDNFKVKPGWKVVKEAYVNTPTIKNLKVTNTGGPKRTAQLTFRFYKGKNVLAEVECSSNEMQKGETSALDCFSTSNHFPKGYKTVKVADMW